MGIQELQVSMPGVGHANVAQTHNYTHTYTYTHTQCHTNTRTTKYAHTEIELAFKHEAMPRSVKDTSIR